MLSSKGAAEKDLVYRVPRICNAETSGTSWTVGPKLKVFRQWAQHVLRTGLKAKPPSRRYSSLGPRAATLGSRCSTAIAVGIARLRKPTCHLCLPGNFAAYSRLEFWSPAHTIHCLPISLNCNRPLPQSFEDFKLRAPTTDSSALNDCYAYTLLC